MKIGIMTKRQWWTLGGIAGVSCLLILALGPEMIPLLIMLGMVYGAVRVISFLLSRPVSRLPISIRWKVLGAILSMGGLLVATTIVSVAAMDYMHTELHDIQSLAPVRPAGVLPAVNELESTQHGTFFSFAPLIAVLGTVGALGLGVAIAVSLITPVRRMSEAMKRIASGDFSQPVRVDNRDELGELAERINETAHELSRLQEATVAAERARALRDRVTQVTLAQEEERRRISRELHDDLGPSLAAIVNRLRSCQHIMRSDPERAERELEEVTTGLKGHIQDIRTLIHDLRPLAVDQLGLAGAIEQQIERFSKDTGIPASSNISFKAPMDPLLEITVFRVLQECLSNVQKHAGATRVEVALQPTVDGLQLVITDNGRGFAPDEIASAKDGQGVGLTSMRERAELVEGRLTIISSPQSGCAVTLYVPSEVRAAGSSKEVAVGANSHPAG